MYPKFQEDKLNFLKPFLKTRKIILIAALIKSDDSILDVRINAQKQAKVKLFTPS